MAAAPILLMEIGFGAWRWWAQSLKYRLRMIALRPKHARKGTERKCHVYS